MNSPQRAPRRKLSTHLPLLLLLLALAGAALFWTMRPAQGNLSGAQVGGPFTLVDETGRSVTSASFDGKWRLMYFGFTYCPDVCPTDMAKMAAGLRAFEKAHPDRMAKLQPIFVTVDPERDTPAAVREFTDSFHPAILGLTGSRAEIDAALKTFRVYASKVPGTAPDAYTYDHLAIFYLMDPKGRPVEFLAASSATPEQVTAMLERFLA